MFGEPDGRGIERGDKIRKSCKKCGDSFTRIEGKDDNVSRCKNCYEAYQEIRENHSLAAGTWVCRNETFRNAVREFAEDEFGYVTYVEGDKIYFFEEDE